MTRISLLLNRFVSENRRTILLMIGITFGIFLLSGLFLSKNMSTSDMTVTLMVVDMSIFSIFLTIFGSLTFSSMSTKPRRISEMMLPASKSEKFISALIVYTLGGIIIGLLSWFLSIVISTAIYGKLSVFFSNMSDFISLCGKSEVIVFLFFAGIMLLGLALYTLGSAMWPKRSFIKTFVALFVAQFLLTFIPFMGIFREFHYGFHGMGWVIVAGLYVVIIGIYLLAWFRFRNSQLVQTFMMD